MRSPDRPAVGLPKARTHLMVAGQSRAPAPTTHSTVMVQRWVITVLMISVFLHLAAGLVVAAYFAESRGLSSQIGLLVIAGVMGCLVVGAAFAVHQRSPLTPWVAMGLVPSVVGAYFCFIT